MRINTFLKGALAGGVGATAVLGATAAFAGSGIGGVFNLGATNTTNAYIFVPPSRRAARRSHQVRLQARRLVTAVLRNSFSRA